MCILVTIQSYAMTNPNAHAGDITKDSHLWFFSPRHAQKCKHLHINILPTQAHTQPFIWCHGLQKCRKVTASFISSGEIITDSVLPLLTETFPPQTSFKTHYTHRGTRGLSASARVRVLPSYVMRVLILIHWFISDGLTQKDVREANREANADMSYQSMCMYFLYITTFGTVQVQVCCPKPLICARVLCSDPEVISRPHQPPHSHPPPPSLAFARPLLIVRVVWETREPSVCDPSAGAWPKSIKSLFVCYLLEGCNVVCERRFPNRVNKTWPRSHSDRRGKVRWPRHLVTGPWMVGCSV